MTTTDEDDPVIPDTWIRNEFQWDRMSDVKWDIVRSNYEATSRILANPAQFPKADFEVVAERKTNLFTFLSMHG